MMKPSAFHLLVDEVGVRLRDVKSQADVWRVQWADVREIAAWKDDVFCYDIICMGFRIGDEDAFFECDEKRAGWDALNAALLDRFGVRWENWFSVVAYPAFVLNWTVLWHRSEAPTPA